MKWIVIVLILMALPVLWLRGGLFQEPLSTVWVAAKLEVSQKTAMPLATQPPSVLMQSAALDDFLAAKGADGWEFREQLGSGAVSCAERSARSSCAALTRPDSRYVSEGR